MFPDHSAVVLELVRRSGELTPADVEALKADHAATGRSIVELVLTRELMPKPDLLRLVAEHCGMDYVEAASTNIPSDVMALVPPRLAREFRIMPWRLAGERLDVFCVDPFRPNLAAELTFALGIEVRLFLADPNLVESRIRQFYSEEGATSSGHPGAGSASIGSRKASAAAAAIVLGELEAAAEKTPIIEFVDLILSRAVREGASDIHFEPFERNFQIRYRVDGVLFETAPPPRAMALPVTSRLKVMANLNIAERRIPQDGRIKLTLGGRPVDLRVSTLPTQFGESVVLRVLDQSRVQLDLAQLGLPPDVFRGVSETVRRPNGIFLVTGPTGSGKTTTLYSALRAINSAEVKLLTAEDPIEYEIEGMMQVPVNPAAGLTFASALRSFLRQDPDVIMVGEIRDLETAQIAIQAALTGHLVLSTLHTNDAAGAVTRLVDMGVEPFLLASTLNAVLAQRLLRRLCPDCRRRTETGSTASDGNAPMDDSMPLPLMYSAPGCPRCHQSGYRGRCGIFEWLPITDELRELVTQRAPTVSIRRKAVEQGMRTLRADGRRALLAGETSVEEVLKYT